MSNVSDCCGFNALDLQRRSCTLMTMIVQIMHIIDSLVKITKSQSQLVKAMPYLLILIHDDDDRLRSCLVRISKVHTLVLLISMHNVRHFKKTL